MDRGHARGEAWTERWYVVGNADAPSIQERAAAGEEIHVNRAARVAAPLAAFAAAMIVRRVLAARYRSAASGPVPDPKDLRVTFLRTLAWATLTSVVTAAVEVSVIRAIDRAGAHAVADEA